MPLFLAPIIAFFTGLPVKWIIYGVIALAIVAGALYYRGVLIQKGHDQAIQEINDANNQEKKQADQGQYTVDQCYAAGGDWNRDNGVCDHPAR